MGVAHCSLVLPWLVDLVDVIDYENYLTAIYLVDESFLLLSAYLFLFSRLKRLTVIPLHTSMCAVHSPLANLPSPSSSSRLHCLEMGNGWGKWVKS